MGGCITLEEGGWKVGGMVGDMSGCANGLGGILEERLDEE